MIEIIKAEAKPNSRRLGIVIVKYYGLVIFCEICCYKDKHFWIRLPEIWECRDYKKQYVWFETNQESDLFQAEVLKKAFDMMGIPMTASIAECKDFFISKKELTEGKNKLTLKTKISGV